MSMDRVRAREIARGYMAPPSPAINQFAQSGNAGDGLRLAHELGFELEIKRKELERRRGDLEAELETRLEIEELDHLITWVELRGFDSTDSHPYGGITLEGIAAEAARIRREYGS